MHNRRICFWVNYAALVISVFGFNWWLAIVSADKTFSDALIRPINAFALLLLGILGALLGDFETETVKSKGVKRFVIPSERFDISLDPMISHRLCFGLELMQWDPLFLPYPKGLFTSF